MVGKKKSALLRAATTFFAINMFMLVGLKPASAQGMIEQIFNSLHQSREVTRAPTNLIAFVDPLTSLTSHTPSAPRPQFRASAAGSAKAFCVRSCDGHYFPVQAHAGLSAAQSCRAFCPASPTRLYTGGTIDHAVANDGSRYADMPNAFLYRRQLVAGCTCNGRNAFGLAQIDARNDPTLRQGDIVATEIGLMAYTGNRNNVAGFTPVENYSRLSKSTRERLSETRIMPTTSVALQSFASVPSPAATAMHADSRSAQLTR